VINILTGFRQELIPHVAGHMDVNAVVARGADLEERKTLQTEGSRNVKRVVFLDGDGAEDPGRIMDVQEVKTTWHPVGY